MDTSFCFCLFLWDLLNSNVHLENICCVDHAGLSGFTGTLTWITAGHMPLIEATWGSNEDQTSSFRKEHLIHEEVQSDKLSCRQQVLRLSDWRGMLLQTQNSSISELRQKHRNCSHSTTFLMIKYSMLYHDLHKQPESGQCHKSFSKTSLKK